MKLASAYKGEHEMAYITRKEAFLLGYLYYLVSSQRPDYEPPISIQCFAPESQTPLKCYEEAYALAHSQGAITKNLEEQLSAIFAEIHPGAKDEEDLPLEKRGAWQSGYYYAFQGRPIPRGNQHNDELLELRATLGVTQEKFAQLVGVFVGTIAKAECGRRTVSDAMMERIRTRVAQEQLRRQ